MALPCPNCQQNNSDNAQRCQNCGTFLSYTIEMQSVSPDNETNAMLHNNETTDKLDETKIIAPLDDAILAEEAKGATDDSEDDLTHATTKMPNMNDEDGLLHIGSVRFRGSLILKDKERNITHRVENDQLDEVIVGRLDADTGFRPQIDFTDTDGKERGVSRRHATINQRGDLIFVTDHNSLNGTYLNGQRLVPEQSRVMRDSDSLRIGHISLIVSFEE